jgi:hypothetical protein
MRVFIRFLGVLIAALLVGLTGHAQRRSRPFRNRSHRWDD